MNLHDALNDIPDVQENKPPVPGTPRTIRRPNFPGEEVTTTLTEKEALIIISKLRNGFAESLVTMHRAYGKLSLAQWYWVFKLAEDSKPLPVLKLKSDLQSFCNKVALLQFQVELPDKTIGKVLLRTTPEGILVQHAWRTWGTIIDDEYQPKRETPAYLQLLLLALSLDPIRFLMKHGKETGRCCICGRELTNEVSVELGIGPICMERLG